MTTFRQNLFIIIATDVHNKLTLKTTIITSTLSSATPDFIPHTLWPPNSPDLNPVDYKIWSAMEERVYWSKVRDVEDLRGCILQAWDGLDQRIIDKAVGEWRKRLRLCVNAAGRQFEYKLWLVIYSRFILQVKHAVV